MHENQFRTPLKFFIGGLILLQLLTCTNFAQATDFVSCKVPPERQIIDSLLDLDLPAVTVVLKQHKPETWLIDSPEFYTALAQWIDALSRGRDITKSRQKLQISLTNSKQPHTSTDIDGANLSWSLASAFTARALLYEKRFLAAIKLGDISATHLDKIFQSSKADQSSRAAVAFFLGLYHIYNSSVPKLLSKKRARISASGDVQEGLRLIEYTIRHSDILGPEAARTLLLETPWITPEYCGYIDLAANLTSRYPGNPDISIAYQGLLLRCGHPLLAYHENQRIVSFFQHQTPQGYYQVNYSGLFTLGRYRANADLKQINQLVLIDKDKKRNYYRLYALANALDISHERSKSLAIYHKLAQDNGTPNSIRINSRLRLNSPYIPPETVSLHSNVMITDCPAAGEK